MSASVATAVLPQADLDFLSEKGWRFEIAPHPGEVVGAEAGARDDEEAVGREARHGEIAFDAAARIEHLRIGHAPRRLRHVA